jgi:MFS family permease
MNQNPRPLLLYWSVFVACLGGFLQSYAACVIAGALFFLAAEFQLTPFQEGNAAAMVLIGALIGSLGSGRLADRFGRKPALILSAVLYFATGAGSFFVGSFSSFLLLRFVSGLALGITSILSPMYLAEIAPADIPFVGEKFA